MLAKQIQQGLATLPSPSSAIYPTGPPTKDNLLLIQIQIPMLRLFEQRIITTAKTPLHEPLPYPTYLTLPLRNYPNYLAASLRNISELSSFTSQDHLLYILTSRSHFHRAGPFYYCSTTSAAAKVRILAYFQRLPADHTLQQPRSNSPLNRAGNRRLRSSTKQ